jgi:putative ATPase
LNLAHGVAYLANTPKDRSATNAIGEATDDARKYGNLPVPMKIRNAPTRLMKRLGYGKDEGTDPQNDLFPEKLRGRKYFKGE